MHDSPPQIPSRIAVFTWSGALGDILLLTPLLQQLRIAYPSSSLSLFAGLEPARFLVSCGLADHAGAGDDSVFAPLAGGSVADRARILTALGNPDLLIMFARDISPAREALMTLRIPFIVRNPWPPAGTHAAHNLLLALDTAGIPITWAGPGSVRPLSQSGVAETESRSSSSRPYLIHPGAGAGWKCAPAGLFSTVACALAGRGDDVIILQGPADADHVEAVNWYGDIALGLTLSQLSQLISASRGFIGNDSGPTHLAALLGIPTVALFGPTHPDTWGPIGPQVTVIRACTNHPADSIRICHDPECLRAITADSVLAAIG